MVRLGQSVLDTVCVAKHVEHMDAPPSSGSKAVLRQIGELDAVVGEHGVDFVGNGLDEGFEEVRSDPAIGLLMKFGIDELSCPSPYLGGRKIPALRRQTEQLRCISMAEAD
jgi:hypothetical protein